MKLEIEVNTQTFSSKNSSSKKKTEAIADLFESGIQAAENGDRDEARRAFLRVTEAEPQNENAWLWLASTSEYPEELLAFLQHVLKIDPQNERALEWSANAQISLAETFVRHGNNSAQNGKTEIARRCFLRAVKHNPQHSAAWLELSALAETPEEKMSCLEQVLKAEPDNEEALAAVETIRQENIREILKKANLAAISGEREIALRLLEEVSQNAPDLEDVWVLKAYLAEETDEKISCFEKILELNSGNEAAQIGLAAIRAQMQKIEEQKSLTEALKAAFEEKSLPLEEENDSSPVPEEIQHANACDEEFSGDILAEEFSANEVFSLESEESKTSVAENFAGDESSSVAQIDESFRANFDSEKSESTAERREFPEELSSRNLSSAKGFPKQGSKSSACPFCYMMNAPETLVCSSCRTMISLSDLEMLLGYQAADPEVLQTVIRNLEIARNNQNISVNELVLLSIACFNAKDLRSGLHYLREASILKPEDISLISKVNFLTNRIAEIEMQTQKTVKQRLKTSTIMIVDDNPTIVKLVSGKLEKCGHKVIPATGGEEALTKISDVTPDLILLDIAMPKMDGYQVCKIIRSKAETKDVPVLMISSKEGVFNETRGKVAGSNGFIAKPFGPETLMRTIETYLS